MTACTFICLIVLRCEKMKCFCTQERSCFLVNWITLKRASYMVAVGGSENRWLVTVSARNNLCCLAFTYIWKNADELMNCRKKLLRTLQLQPGALEVAPGFIFCWSTFRGIARNLLKGDKPQQSQWGPGAELGIAIPGSRIPGSRDPGPFFNPEIPGLWKTKSRDFGIRK